MVTSFDTPTKYQVNWNVLPLDPKLFRILDIERSFFKAHTGIENDEELRDHIIRIQEAAYSAVPYPCIRLFSFLRLNITRAAAYQKTLRLGEDRPGAIFLEVGPGFGTDSRKLISDGFHIENVVVTDLHEELWDAGHKLFRSSPESFPVTFIPGDFFEVTEGLDGVPSSGRPDLRSLRSLLSLKGHVSIIYTALFFHLFDEQRGRELAERLSLLLSPERGSLIFGIHLGAPEPTLQTTPAGTMFCHSPKTFKQMWADIFPRSHVKIEAELLKTNQSIANAFAGKKVASDIWTLIWSVERV